jgi:hypothetical protein
MSQHHKQARARRSAERELDDAELDAVIGGAGFLSGSLTTEQVAAAHVDTDARAQGILMRETIIVRPF